MVYSLGMCQYNAGEQWLKYLTDNPSGFKELNKQTVAANGDAFKQQIINLMTAKTNIMDDFIKSLDGDSLSFSQVEERQIIESLRCACSTKLMYNFILMDSYFRFKNPLQHHVSITMAYLHQVQNTQLMPYMLANNKSLHQATGYVPIWPPLHCDQKVFQQLQMMLFVRVNRELFTSAMLRPILIKTEQQAQGVFEEILWHLLGWITRYKIETDWDTFKRQYVNFDVISNLVRAYGARLEAD